MLFKNIPNSYGEFEDGNQMSFQDFQKYIDEYYPDSGIDFFKDCLPKMKAIIKHSLLSVRKKLNPNNIDFSFELFGYDFIMDADFNLWLIEVNTNPCLEESSKLLKHYLRRMVEDMIKLEIDPRFPNPRRKKSNSPIKDRKHKRRRKWIRRKGKRKIKRKTSMRNEIITNEIDRDILSRECQREEPKGNIDRNRIYRQYT